MYWEKEAEKETGIDERRIGWFGWRYGRCMEKHIATGEVSSDVSNQRPEDDPITGSFVGGQRPAKKKNSFKGIEVCV
jgi:hypothetical protein